MWSVRYVFLTLLFIICLCSPAFGVPSGTYEESPENPEIYKYQASIIDEMVIAQLLYWDAQTEWKLSMWIGYNAAYVHVTDIPNGFYEWWIDTGWMEKNEHIRPQR